MFLPLSGGDIKKRPEEVDMNNSKELIPQSYLNNNELQIYFRKSAQPIQSVILGGHYISLHDYHCLL
jgi:hypothetical protein